MFFLIPQTPFEWASDHLHLVGWPLIVLIAWKARGYVEAFLADVKEVKASVAKWDTNHLPHMEESLKNLEGVGAEQTKLFTSMDKSMALLVDRTK